MMFQLDEEELRIIECDDSTYYDSKFFSWALNKAYCSSEPVEEYYRTTNDKDGIEYNVIRIRTEVVDSWSGRKDVVVDHCTKYIEQDRIAVVSSQIFSIMDAIAETIFNKLHFGD